MESIGIIIPYYRAPELLKNTLLSILKAIENALSCDCRYRFEIVIVDDSADDPSFQALQQIVEVTAVSQYLE